MLGLDDHFDISASGSVFVGRRETAVRYDVFFRVVIKEILQLCRVGDRNSAQYRALVVGQPVVGADQSADGGIVGFECVGVAVAGGAVDVFVQRQVLVVPDEGDFLVGEVRYFRVLVGRPFADARDFLQMGRVCVDVFGCRARIVELGVGVIRALLHRMWWASRCRGLG
ncbi:hypothetical protein GCM10023318_37510 [Nocardia callitridis]|uniref:Uncharacterized protein n=1 Tax=Nocardia callitridis TaxID=648753 RepID=A0ABP9KK50_9NOCA